MGIPRTDFTREKVSQTLCRVEIFATPIDLELRHAFRIARPRTTPWRNVLVRVVSGNVQGLGEASPSAYYGETAGDICRKLGGASSWLAKLELRTVADLEQAWLDSWKWLAPSRAAQCALDLALWDWLAKRNDLTVSELALGTRPQPVTTFCTIGLSTIDELHTKLAELAGFPRIKMKSDAAADLTSIRAACARTSSLVAVDANCAWRAARLPELSRALAGLGVTFLEQPLAPQQDAQLPPTPRPLPIFADESCVLEGDIERLSGRFDGFNIKLVKCGGLTPALRMARRGRELGLRAMAGCMVETSALIAAGAVVAQLTEFADLDGAWLLARDPIAGWRFERGVLHPPENIPGLGIAPLVELR